MCVDQEESWEERVVVIGWRVKKGGKENWGIGVKGEVVVVVVIFFGCLGAGGCW